MRKTEMPPLPSASLENSEEAAPVQAPKNIEVVALRNGFFAQERKVEGDKFVVPTMKQLGSWMRCLDPRIEKMHQDFLKAKRSKANTAVE